LETKKIDALRKNGLKVIELHNEIIKGKECYYTGKIEMLKIRQSKGEQYYESDSTADIYISQDLIDIVGDGHKKIKTKEEEYYLSYYLGGNEEDTSKKPHKIKISFPAQWKGDFFI